MENLICKNAGKSYKEKTVLKNVNLELEPGKIYGLIGRMVRERRHCYP